MLRITLSVEGEIVIDRLLAGLEERAKDMRPAWPELVKVFQQITKAAFDTEGKSTGAPWAPLAERTQRDRQRQGYGPAHPILQRTTQLQRALTIGEGAYIKTTAESMAYLLAPHIDYFIYHQSRKPRKKIPRRAPVLLTADDRHELFRPIRLYLTGRDPSARQRARVG